MQLQRCALSLAIPVLAFAIVLSSFPKIPLITSTALAQNIMDQDPKNEADRFYQEGNQLIDQGQYKMALEKLQLALRIYQQLGHRQEQGNTLNSIGGAYGGLGECPQQLDYFQQSLSIQQEVSNRQMESIVLNHIGTAHVCLGQYSQALELYQRALAISKELDNRSGLALILNNIGSIHDISGQYEEAL
ncbi:MAG TPA: tetratricopeptide repeat protein, partial [Leptolyngbyaceae cyanobacterium]